MEAAFVATENTDAEMLPVITTQVAKVYENSWSEIHIIIKRPPCDYCLF